MFDLFGDNKKSIASLRAEVDALRKEVAALQADNKHGAELLQQVAVQANFAQKTAKSNQIKVSELAHLAQVLGNHIKQCQHMVAILNDALTKNTSLSEDVRADLIEKTAEHDETAETDKVNEDISKMLIKDSS